MPPPLCVGGRGGGRGGGGGGGQQASCLVAKQAVEFPQVLASIGIMTQSHSIKYRNNDTEPLYKV